MGIRRLKNWIESYREYTDNSEAPISYHIWSGLSCLMAVMQRKVYMRWGFQTIYPNEYIILVGRSGLVRKGDPIVIAKDLIEQIGIKLIAEDNSEEVIIQDMEQAVINYTDEFGEMRFHCSVTCMTEELSVLVGNQNTRFLAYLTNWYDSRDKWERRTKNRGSNKLHGVCFNLLAATAPDWLPYMFTKESVGGGFTSRCIFVVEDRKRKSVWDPNEGMPSHTLRDKLIEDLEQIHLLIGEMKFNSAAKEAYKHWYMDHEEKMQGGKVDMSDPAFTGYMSRKPTHVKKIAMALSAARGDDMIVAEKDFQQALELLKVTEKKMPDVFVNLGRAQYSEDINLVMTFLRQHKRVSYKDLMTTFYRDIDDSVMEKILKVLEDMGVLTASKLPGKKPVFEWIGD